MVNIHNLLSIVQRRIFSLLGGPNAPAAREPEVYVPLSTRPHH